MRVLLGGPQLLGVEQKVQLEEVEGRVVNLSCEALGYPLPSISWNITGSQVPSPSFTARLYLTVRDAICPAALLCSLG